LGDSQAVTLAQTSLVMLLAQKGKIRVRLRNGKKLGEEIIRT